MFCQESLAAEEIFMYVAIGESLITWLGEDDVSGYIRVEPVRHLVAVHRGVCSRGTDTCCSNT
jgi:hypothetical protein